MKEILGTFWRQFVIAYLDDLIIYSQTEEEHLAVMKHTERYRQDTTGLESEEAFESI